MSCIFCKIARNEIPTKIIYQDEKIISFADLDPQAPIHYLIIPKQHIATLNDLSAENIDIIGDMFLAVKKIAADLGISENGYRTLINCNANGGQTVYHLHLHFLGGRIMEWPPG